MVNFRIVPYTLHFKRPAGTSRGVYVERKVWYVELYGDSAENNRRGVGECAPLPNLSCDSIPDYEQVLQHFMSRFINENTVTDGMLEISDELLSDLLPYPSILFGLESAVWQYNVGSIRLSDTAFSRGERGIQINGLIWMGTYSEMKERIEEKLRHGFRCVKLKIGAINFEDELDLLKMIRKHYPKDVIELRVDANGAFNPGDDALRKLEVLSKLDLHSIEQPIKAGQYEAMSYLCNVTPIPIALDEELIGTDIPKSQLLDIIKPQYIILKPSLHGGLFGSNEWIRLAEERNIGWWVTSALESNVGLNAISHWCAIMQEENPERMRRPQGLGTGQLFTDNINYPLVIKGDEMWFKQGEE